MKPLLPCLNPSRLLSYNSTNKVMTSDQNYHESHGAWCMKPPPPYSRSSDLTVYPFFLGP